jgi:hypothetical protein
MRHQVAVLQQQQQTPAREDSGTTLYHSGGCKRRMGRGVLTGVASILSDWRLGSEGDEHSSVLHMRGKWSEDGELRLATRLRRGCLSAVETTTTQRALTLCESILLG